MALFSIHTHCPESSSLKCMKPISIGCEAQGYWDIFYDAFGISPIYCCLIFWIFSLLHLILHLVIYFFRRRRCLLIFRCWSCRCSPCLCSLNFSVEFSSSLGSKLLRKHISRMKSCRKKRRKILYAATRGMVAEPYCHEQMRRQWSHQTKL